MEENIKLKDNKNNSVIIEDIDKVNFEELTETDKKLLQVVNICVTNMLKRSFINLMS